MVTVGRYRARRAAQTLYLEDRTGDRTVSRKPPVSHGLLAQACGFRAAGWDSMGRAGIEPATLGLKVRP
jgi:hypothetical protein